MGVEIHGFQIRSGTIDDVEAVVALDRATVLLPHWAAGEYMAALASGSNAPPPNGVYRTLFVADSADALAGFTVVKIAHIANEVTAELESLAVALASRRLSIGRALCVEAIHWSRLQGAASIELEVRSGNEAATALYASLGFVVRGVRARYYRDPTDDAVLMRLGLI